MIVVLAALLCQAKATIDGAELLTGGAYRPGHWAPLEVRITTPGPLDGELAIRTDFGFTIVAPVKAGGEGRQKVVVPILALGLGAPLDVSLRSGGREVDRLQRRELGTGLFETQLLVAVERGESVLNLPEVAVFTFDPRDPWRDEYFEAVDAFVGKAPDFPAWRLRGGRACSSGKDLESILKEVKHRTALVEPLDREAWDLAPAGAWIESKRKAAVLFAAVNLVAGLLVLFVLLRFPPRPGVTGSAVALFAGLGVLAYVAFFPRGKVSVVRQSCVLSDGETALSVDFQFVRRSEPGKVVVDFPALVKPLYQEYRQASTDAFELRVEGAGCRVTAPVTEARGFSSWSPAPSPLPRPAREGQDVRVEAVDDLFDAGIARKGKVLLMGSVKKGGAARAAPGDARSDPQDPVVKYAVTRFAGDGDLFFARLASGDAPSHRVKSAELAEERARAPILIRPIR